LNGIQEVGGSIPPGSTNLVERNGACGCSSGVEHNLAKVGVEGSNPFARSSLFMGCRGSMGVIENSILSGNTSQSA
jgi:hypothetical protein